MLRIIVRRALAPLIAAILYPSTSWAATLGPPLTPADLLENGLISNYEALEIFELGNRCQPITFSVHISNENAAGKIGVTQETIEVAVRSRLRPARLYKALAVGESADLHIALYVMGNADNGFAGSVELEFWKYLRDDASGLTFKAPTGWDAGFIFQGSGGRQHIVLPGVAEKLDKFIDDYLRVNEAEC